MTLQLHNIIDLQNYSSLALNLDSPVISVLGLGYVGAVTSACLSNIGYSVIGMDKDKVKVDSINKGISPIFEMGLPSLIRESVEHNNLYAVDDIDHAVLHSDITFLCICTPSGEHGECDLSHLINVCESVGKALKYKNSHHTVVIKSTVPPLTTQNELIPVLEKYSNKKAGEGFGVCFNPEFLRESTAIEDFNNPAVTVLGVSDKLTESIMSDIFNNFETKIEVTSIEVAEFVKYVNNCWHATKVTFTNEISRLCGAMEVDACSVMKILTADHKLNTSAYYMKPGFAFGGSCLPKDTRGIKHLAQKMGVSIPMIAELNNSNSDHIDFVVERILKVGLKEVGLVGLTFKALTDDMRESPNLVLMQRLIKAGVDVSFYDPLVHATSHLGTEESLRELIQKTQYTDLGKFVAKNKVIVLSHNDDTAKHALTLLSDEHFVIELDCKEDDQC
ncbi:MAG: UDP-glucose/GDP-mannose dehydrogenase family protein [Saccharospirillaceae bacterium]|nr:nucleotide sugar dehydrogenase [Pseudomonadales bacterium]NRB81214.1 UDP-glucose/GDP-mannose dehydrogenase family protein [Saccharospirillaceae bacterium]